MWGLCLTKENISKEIEIIKKKTNKWKLRSWKYNKWNEKFTRAQEQMWISWRKISKLEDRSIEIILSEEQQQQKNEENE